MNSHILVEQIDKHFDKTTTKEIHALDSISFSVKKGEFFCIVGPNGAGKTTLLNIVAGFEKPTNGIVRINGNRVIGPNGRYVTMFQEHALFPWRTVLSNVEYGLEIKGIGKAEREEIAREYIELVGLRGFENSHPSRLSGGMKQRVQLARTLAVEPEIIFMDEPFGALDPITKRTLQQELEKIWKHEKKTIIFVTHDIDSAIRLGDRIAIMSPQPGKIKEIIDVGIERPRDRFDPKFAEIEKRILENI
jgi:NitT/TauT family transport system ATP-binding protein